MVNLASDEYSRVVRPARLGAEIVSPRFEDVSQSGQTKVISFFAKRARGEMAAWIVQHRIRGVRALRQFAGAGYRLDEARSTRLVPVFVRGA